MHHDTFVAQHRQDRGRDVAIFPSGELWSHLDDRHTAAEAAIGLGQFQSDIAAADDEQVVGQPIELERLDIGERLCRRKAGNLRDHGVRPEIENHPMAGQHARAAIVQAHLDGLRRDEPARTHDQLGAARLVLVEVHGDQPVDHVALARQHSVHVDGDGTDHHSKPIGVVNQIGDFCAPNLVLTGEAIGVRTGTANQFALNYRGAMSQLGHVPGQKFAAFATSEHEHLELLRLGHRQLLLAP